MVINGSASPSITAHDQEHSPATVDNRWRFKTGLWRIKNDYTWCFKKNYPLNFIFSGYMNLNHSRSRTFWGPNNYRLVFCDCLWSNTKNAFSRNLWKYDVEFITSRSKKTRTTIAIKITRKTTTVFLVIKTNWKQFNPTTLLHSVIFIDWTYWDWFLCCLCVCVVIYSALPFC